MSFRMHGAIITKTSQQQISYVAKSGMYKWVCRLHGKHVLKSDLWPRRNTHSFNKRAPRVGEVHLLFYYTFTKTLKTHRSLQAVIPTTATTTTCFGIGTDATWTTKTRRRQTCRERIARFGSRGSRLASTSYATVLAPFAMEVTGLNGN